MIQDANSDYVASEERHKRINSDLHSELDTVQKQLERSQQDHREDQQKLMRLQQELRMMEEADEEKRVFAYLFWTLELGH